MIALLCPGQGSQTPGMLAPWLELPGAADYLTGLGEAAGIDLVHLGTEADADAIKDTRVAQPLIVAASLLSLRLLEDRVGTGWAGVVAGHSVGEFAAAAAAGVLSARDAVALVGVRGRAMAAAAALEETGMAAVLGGDPEEVAATLASLDLVGANVNGGGQVVAAGSLAALAALAENPPTKARIMALKVAGAFHTRYMAPAVDEVAAAAAALSPADPATPLLTNADGTAVADGASALTGLVAQITRPVRWDLCQQTMLADGVTAAVELAPGGVLAGLARRAMTGVATVALKKPEDLDAAATLIEANR